MFLILAKWGNQATATGIAFSPNSQVLASSSVDGSIRLWKRDDTLLTAISGTSGGRIER